MLIHLHIVPDWFHDTTAELSSCYRDWLAESKLFTTWPFAEKVCQPLHLTTLSCWNTVWLKEYDNNNDINDNNNNNNNYLLCARHHARLFLNFLLIWKGIAQWIFTEYTCKTSNWIKKQKITKLDTKGKNLSIIFLSSILVAYTYQ